MAREEAVEFGMEDEAGRKLQVAPRKSLLVERDPTTAALSIRRKRDLVVRVPTLGLFRNKGGGFAASQFWWKKMFRPNVGCRRGNSLTAVLHQLF